MDVGVAEIPELWYVKVISMQYRRAAAAAYGRALVLIQNLCQTVSLSNNVILSGYVCMCARCCRTSRCTTRRILDLGCVLGDAVGRLLKPAGLVGKSTHSVIDAVRPVNRDIKKKKGSSYY